MAKLHQNDDHKVILIFLFLYRMAPEVILAMEEGQYDGKVGSLFSTRRL